MKNRRLILLVLVIAAIFLLTSCTFTFDITFTTPVESSIVVTSGGAQGLIYVNGENTGKYLRPFQSKTIYNIPCYQSVSVCLVGPYGYPSHTAWIYTEPGVNYVYFDYLW